MELFLAASIISLMFITVFSLVITFYNTRWVLIFMIPLVIAIGMVGITSYKSMLGYPVNIEWHQMPNKWTAIFFRVKDKDSISIWLLENKTTRLVKLPYIKKAQDALEAEKKKMGSGTPVTFGKNKKSSKGGKGVDGWKYGVKSYGDPIRGILPKKQ